MKNLILFLQKFKYFIFFAVLQIFSIFLYVNNYNYPNTVFFTSANHITSSLLKTSNDFTQFINTPQANVTLQKENIELRNENQKLRALLDTVQFKDTTFQEQAFEYIPAQVIYSTYGKRNNYITINRGSKDGIKEGMGVFTSKGVVGIVHQSTEHNSVIKSVLSSKIYIDVKIDKNGAFGLLNWDGKHYNKGNIDGISSDIPLKRWAKVVTRGKGGVFPSGLYVGQISNFYMEETKPLWNITVLYKEDFRRLSNVYVIRNIQQHEMDTLTQIVNEEQDRP